MERIILLTIDHKHGTNTYACRDDETAEQELCQYVRTQWDVTGNEGDVKMPEDPDEAIEMYFGFHQEDEWYSIEGLEVIGSREASTCVPGPFSEWPNPDKVGQAEYRAIYEVCTEARDDPALLGAILREFAEWAHRLLGDERASVDALIAAGKEVVENWENGDLAGAVNRMRELIEDIKAERAFSRDGLKP